MFKIFVIVWFSLFTVLKYLDFVPEYSWWWLLGVPVTVWLVLLIVQVLLLVFLGFCFSLFGKGDVFHESVRKSLLKRK